MYDNKIFEMTQKNGRVMVVSEHVTAISEGKGGKIYLSLSDGNTFELKGYTYESAVKEYQKTIPIRRLV